MTCPLCKNSLFLGGMEALGRCPVCVTPEAMLALRAELDEATAELEERYGEMKEEGLVYLRSRIDRYISQHPEAGDPSAWTWTDAEEALADYLSTLPCGAYPAGSTGNDKLDRLREILT